jgi:menaquinone-specific isochorismate synthase
MNVPDAPYVLQLPNGLHLATDITGVADKGVASPSTCRGATSDRRGLRHAYGQRMIADR